MYLQMLKQLEFLLLLNYDVTKMLSGLSHFKTVVTLKHSIQI